MSNHITTASHLENGFSVRLNEHTGFIMPQYHFHDHLEILLSLSDAGDIFVGGDRFPLRKGALLFVGNAELHRSITPNAVYRRYIIHVSPEELSDLFRKGSNLFACLGETHKYKQLTECQLNLLTEMLERSRQTTRAFADDIRRQLAFGEFLLALQPLFDQEETALPLRGSDYERIAPILEYIKEHFAEKITLERISSTFFISKHHLCHLFKSVTGFSVMEYVIHTRILIARGMLRKGHSVIETAACCGFGSYSHFIRTFTSLVGLSPTMYAKQYHKATHEGATAPND